MMPGGRLVITCLLTLALTACSLSQQKLSPAEITQRNTSPHREETIALLGATGMAGGYILQEALAQGYRIKALARSPQKLAYLNDRIEIIQGDARDSESIDLLLRGSDTVISALGPVKADGPSAQGLTSAASSLVVAAMKKHAIDRYIVVSGAGVSMPGDRRDLRGWSIQQLARIRYGKLLQERQEELAVLQDSDAHWTLVRCPIIESAPSRQAARVSLTTPVAFKLRAGELAQFILEQLDSEELIRQGPFLGSD